MKNKYKFMIVLSALLCVSTVNIISKQVNAAEVGQLPPTNYSSNLTDTYYTEANNLVGDDLLETLATITNDNHKYYNSYKECQGGNTVSDEDPNDSSKFIDFYTGWSVPEAWDAKIWNREHVWCQSLTNGLYNDVGDSDRGAGADIHHIRPLIYGINSARGNSLYTDREYCGDIKLSEYKYSGNQLSEYANMATGCYNGSGKWEPRDSVKGDIARILMYLYMHYSTEVDANKSRANVSNTNTTSQTGNLVITNIVYTSSGLEEEAWEMLLKWNQLDPVDEFERNRNNYCASVTGTRNPFIDNATYASSIWEEQNLPDGITPYNELTSKVRTYYNQGVYQKKTDINFTTETANELATYFHTGNTPILNRTTYFNGNALIMGDIDGKFDYINSGYGTVTESNKAKVEQDVNHSVNVGDMTHFTLNENLTTVTYNYTVPYSTSFIDYGYEGKGMEAFYTTLENMSKNYFFKEDWQYDESIGYYHEITDKKTDGFLKDFLDITAPLLLTSIYEDTNYFTLDKLVIKEEDGFLSLQILLDSTSLGLTIDNTNVLSEARIYPNIDQFDEKVLEEEKNNTITFALGTNGEASHSDGETNKSSYTEKVNDYTLSINDGVRFYPQARDAKGNSCIKMGISGETGSFSFTVPSDVTSVIIYVAQYKTNKTIVKINGTDYTITTASNNGEYTPIKIDTSVTKTITFATTSSGKRCMINTIEFVK